MEEKHRRCPLGLVQLLLGVSLEEERRLAYDRYYPSLPLSLVLELALRR